MKILHIIPYSPVRPTFGGALRMHHILRLLSERHEVTVAAFGSPDEALAYQEAYGNRLAAVHMVPFRWTTRYRRFAQFLAYWKEKSYFYSAVMSATMEETLRRLVRENRFDVVLTEFSSMGCYTFDTDAVKVLDSHNIEYDNFRRVWEKTSSPLRKLHYYDEYKKFAREEMVNYRRQDVVFFTSERDRSLVAGRLPGVRTEVVPNGVEGAYFAPSAVVPDPFSIVFTGAMSYVPNTDGALWFLDEVFPLILREIPEARIAIVGINPPTELLRRNGPNVTVTGYVDDVRPYVHRASAFVVPLRMGGGTRLKVLEAMAMRKPIVSTRIGCEGIDVRDQESILMADDPAEFARAVVRVLRDEALRARLSAAGAELVRTSYDWEVIGATVERILAGVIAGPRRKDVRP
jgi:glycosyltransferase involved in cell wall biosynthesis